MAADERSGSFAVIRACEGFLYSEPSAEDTASKTIEDILLSGWAVKICEEQPDWARVKTFYGYEGWIRKEELQPVTYRELEERQDRTRYRRICARSADVLTRPKVQGLVLETLLQDALVEWQQDGDGEAAGWSLVRTAAGRSGWVFKSALAERREDDGALLEENPSCFLELAERIIQNTGEDALREGAAQSACSYFGCNYRWGGKSPLGIDCSGLVFMSWMEQGILLYRDAQIRENYPVREIERSRLKKGDLIFFPGHVAMYLEDGHYIHATGFALTPRVCINSLYEDAPDYRADLAGKITMCGSIF